MKTLTPIAALAAGLCLTLGTALAATDTDPRAYQTIAGVSPEPLTEGAGLKSPQELEAFLDGIMTAHLRAQHIAGAVVTVVKDGKIFLSKGYGYQDVGRKIPVDADTTLFRPGSVSKMFTWTALMQLVEQGKVKLDDDVNTYLTQFKIPDTYPGKPITIRNLFTHTEGLEDGGFGYLIVDDPAKLEELGATLAKHMPTRVREPASGDFTNGDMSSYSNWGTSVAGLIIQNVSGLKYDDYIDQKILAPLGMKNSTPRQPLPAALTGQAATGYKYELGEFKPQKFEVVNFAPAGSMSASGTDMGHFMIAHLQKGTFGEQHILGEAAATQMQSRILSPNPYINGACLGFYENHVNGRRVIVHAGDLQYFHTEMNLLPAENVGIFVSYNTSPTLLFSTRTDLFRAFMDRYYPAKLPVVKAPQDFKSRVARYAGSYRIIRHSYTTFEKLFSVLQAMTVAPTDHDTLVVAFGPYVGQYVEVKPDVFRRVDQDDMIAFDGGGTGPAGYLLDPISLPNHMVYRLAWYETPPMLFTIAGFAVLCFIVAIVSAVRHWTLDTNPAARRARRTAALLGAVQLLFLGVAGAMVAILIKNPFIDIPTFFKIGLVLPVLAIPLTLGSLWFAVQALRSGWWTRYARAQYAAIALGATAYLWLLNYVNLIGWKFG